MLAVPRSLRSGRLQARQGRGQTQREALLPPDLLRQRKALSKQVEQLKAARDSLQESLEKLHSDVLRVWERDVKAVEMAKSASRVARQSEFDQRVLDEVDKLGEFVRVLGSNGGGGPSGPRDSSLALDLAAAKERIVRLRDTFISATQAEETRSQAVVTNATALVDEVSLGPSREPSETVDGQIDHGGHEVIDTPSSQGNQAVSTGQLDREGLHGKPPIESNQELFVVSSRGVDSTGPVEIVRPEPEVSAAKSQLGTLESVVKRAQQQVELSEPALEPDRPHSAGMSTRLPEAPGSQGVPKSRRRFGSIFRSRTPERPEVSIPTGMQPIQDPLDAVSTSVRVIDPAVPPGEAGTESSSPDEVTLDAPSGVEAGKKESSQGPSGPVLGIDVDLAQVQESRPGPRDESEPVTQVDDHVYQVEQVDRIENTPVVEDLKVTVDVSPQIADQESLEVEIPKTPQEVALERRDGMLDPILREANRRIKRALQDEQNELMDKVRLEGVKRLLELLGPREDQIDYYGKVTLEVLIKGSTSGALYANGTRKESVSLPSDLATDFACKIVDALRGSITKSYESLGVDLVSNKRESAQIGSKIISGAFRDLKTNFLDSLLSDFMIGAFSRGTIEALGAKAELVWIANKSGAGCPDCEDNALAGPLMAWEEYPTGQVHPPAHSNCRCVIVSAAN